MSVSKETIYQLIADIPQQELEEVADFIGYLKMKRENGILKELSKAAESSLDFWHNKIDDEVWNDA
ncbi:DUF2281 domain-containing protein [Paenibacillus faecis]|uniref:DUF2281 domain-containing protein n=1 Tax=Paenibacillus faecis TaxID=862114 RepID=A0A5D0CTS1_9BACL|nr:DUF2281 domain-containing protein [Paenibacillus faecis]TYA12187.1 DUF2281 domain-containing protein [Paenibacillus faecis]